jgi:Domain of unknown function (DUF1772)
MRQVMEILVHAVTWLLALCFAAAWGAHLFYATVIFPVHAANPTTALIEWLGTPYAKRVFGFWRRAASGLYTVSSVALIGAVVAGLRARPALAVAGFLGLLHMVMVLLLFVPINVKLGLDPGGPGASSLDPQMVTALVRRWGRLNFVRAGVETAGLIAALLALKAS